MRNGIDLISYLARSGPVPAKEICDFFKMSQPTFSRLVAAKPHVFLRIKQGRQVLYAVPRLGGWGKSEIPLLMISEEGQVITVAILHPLSPKGFYVEARHPSFRTHLYENLPYFLEDLKPAGFLGRLVPQLYPDLGFPKDMATWSDDDCLVYLTRCGWDLIGNFIVGEHAYDTYQENLVTRLDVIDEAIRGDRYPYMAELVLSHGVPGSSAAGEQPKFLSILKKREEKKVPVLVKFSPPMGDPIGRRVADLLICEHVAHEVLMDHGKTATQSSLLISEDRLFLEMERFDRNPEQGRYGLISLYALCLEYDGRLQASWSEISQSLLHQKKIDDAMHADILWLEVFGKLIGNTDRHLGNISFFCEGEKIKSLAPVYDMLPMLYAPQHNQIIPRSFAPELPRLYERNLWPQALVAARDFWARIQKREDVSEIFKELAKQNQEILKNLKTPTS